MNLVILASGMARRLEVVHQYIYPKILQNIGNDTVLDKIITSGDFTTITIIVNSELAENQIKEYLSLREYNLNKFTFLIKSESLSTAHTLKYFQEQLPQNNVVIHWSDIYAKSKIEIPNKDLTYIFTNTNYPHRLNFDGEKIYPDDNGNICGIYYLPNLNIFNASELIELESEDFDYVLSKSEVLNEYQVDIEDSGDLSKYVRVLKNIEINTNSRFFNDISFSDTKVTKRSLTQKGNELLRNEFVFYSEFQHLDILPNARSYSSFDNVLELERIDGITVNEFFSNELNEPFKMSKAQMFDKFKRELGQTLHSESESKPLNSNDVRKEYFETLKSRHQSIKSILPEITKVNNQSIPDIDTIYKDVSNFVDIYLRSNTRAHYIHGDTNTSNVMVTLEGLKIIDPRGYFGDTKFYGDKNYDLAKFLYGLSGYDQLNEFTNQLDEYNLFQYENSEIKCIELGDISNITKDIELQMLVAIIWMKLPAYTINNINKAIIAWSNGLRLFYKNYNKYLKHNT